MSLYDDARAVLEKETDERRELVSRKDGKIAELGEHQRAELALFFSDEERRNDVKKLIDEGLEKAAGDGCSLATVLFFENDSGLVARPERYPYGSRVFIGTDEPAGSTLIIAVPASASGIEPSRTYDEKTRCYRNDGELSRSLADGFVQRYAHDGYRCSALRQCCAWDKLGVQVAYGPGFDIRFD